MKARHPILEASSFSDLRRELTSYIDALLDGIKNNPSGPASASLNQLKEINKLISTLEIATSVNDDSTKKRSLALLNQIVVQPHSVAANFIKRTLELVDIRNEARLSQIEKEQRERMKEVRVTIEKEVRVTFETNKLIDELEKRIATEAELKTQYPTLHRQISEEIKKLWEDIQLAIPIRDGGGEYLNDALLASIDKFDRWKNSIPPEKKQISHEVKDWIQHKLGTEIESIKRDQLRRLQEQTRSLDIAAGKSDSSSMDATATNRVQEIQKFLDYLDSWFELPGISKEDFLTNLRSLNDNIPSTGKKKRGGDEVISKIIKQIESGQIPKAEVKQHITESVSVSKSKRETVIDALKSEANTLLAQHHIDKHTLSLKVGGSDSKLPKVIAAEQIRAINKLVSELEHRVDPDALVDADKRISDQELIQKLKQLKDNIHLIAGGKAPSERVINDLISMASKKPTPVKQKVTPAFITNNPTTDALLHQLKSRVGAEKDLASQYPNWNQSFEALVLKGFIEIIERDRLLPKGLKIENQLRSSIKAFDAWKENQLSADKKSVAMKQENKEEAAKIDYGTWMDIHDALSDVTSQLCEKYGLEFVSLGGVDETGDSLGILVPKNNDKKLSDKEVEKGISQIMEVNKLAVNVLRNADFLNKENLLNALMKIKDKMPSTSLGDRVFSDKKAAEKVAINEIITMVHELPTRQHIVSSAWTADDYHKAVETRINIAKEAISRGYFLSDTNVIQQQFDLKVGNLKRLMQTLDDGRPLHTIEAALKKEMKDFDTLWQEKLRRDPKKVVLDEERKTQADVTAQTHEEKKPYSGMNYDELAAVFEQRYLSEALFEWGNARKALASEALWNVVSNQTSADHKGVENQLRSTLMEWDDLKTNPAKDTQESFVQNAISDEKRQFVIKALDAELHSLMGRHGLIDRKVGQNFENASIDLTVLVKKLGNKKSDTDVEITIRRVMEIDGLSLELKKEEPMSEERLHDALTDLKAKMHTTGIRESASAKAIEKIIERVAGKNKELLAQSQKIQVQEKQAEAAVKDPDLLETAVRDSILRLLTEDVERLTSKYSAKNDNEDDFGYRLLKDEDHPKTLTEVKFDTSQKRVGEIKAVISKLQSNEPLSKSAMVEELKQLQGKMKTTETKGLFGTGRSANVTSVKTIDQAIKLAAGENKALLAQLQTKQVEVKQVQAAVKDINLLDEPAKIAIIKLLSEEDTRLDSRYKEPENKRSWEDVEEVVKTPAEIEAGKKFDISNKRRGAIITFVQTLQNDNGTLSKQEVVSKLKELQNLMKTTAPKGLFSGKSANVTSVKTIDKAIKLVGENKSLLARFRGR